MQAEAERAALPAAVPRSSPVQSPPIKRDDLNVRLIELSRVPSAYPDLDWSWLVIQANLKDIWNRLGFVVGLPRELATWYEQIRSALRRAARTVPLACLNQIRLISIRLFVDDLADSSVAARLLNRAKSSFDAIRDDLRAVCTTRVAPAASRFFGAPPTATAHRGRGRRLSRAGTASAAILC